MDETLEEMKAKMIVLSPRIRELRKKLSILEKEFTKLSNTYRRIQMSTFPVKKIPANVSGKPKLHPPTSKVLEHVSASQAAELLVLLERRLVR